MPDSADRVLDEARRRGIPIEFVERPPAASLEEAAALQGITPAEIVKTLVVKRHDGAFLFALVPGDRQLSWPKLRAAVGVNRLRLPDPSVALEVTGYERGTITPFGADGGLPVYADERIRGRRISMGAGRHGRTLWVDADDLIRGYDAWVGDLTEPLAPR